MQSSAFYGILFLIGGDAVQYLNSFMLASEDDEVGYILSYPPKLEMSCYSGQVYPFKVFPQKGLERVEFAPITIFYGGNGSGKSTLLNIIAQKTDVQRTSPFNNTPYFEDYLEFCQADYTFGDRIPRESRIITSDDVFDFLLDIRTVNEGIDRRREEIFEEYDALSQHYQRTGKSYLLTSLSDYDNFKRHNEAKSKSKNQFTKRRLPSNLGGKSNGESAYAYFTEYIREDALYLLDEPENSLSANLQVKLAQFIEEAVRFYRCQFIISTHSPFLLAMRDAKIYDLDTHPVGQREWTELENVRIYHDFFKKHEKKFEKT